jgi:hypothetical protein
LEVMNKRDRAGPLVAGDVEEPAKRQWVDTWRGVELDSHQATPSSQQWVLVFPEVTAFVVVVVICRYRAPVVGLWPGTDGREGSA